MLIGLRVDEYWQQSSRTLSGLFGLSINLVDNPNTVEPAIAFSRNSTKSPKAARNLRYASIPNEIVCTENLTPWIKLLPCGKSRGLATLLKNAPKLFDSKYLSTGLLFRKICVVRKLSKYVSKLINLVTVLKTITIFML